METPATPQDDLGNVDWDEGWPLWNDMVRYYPSGVHRRRLVNEWLRRYAPASVLDAGCGPGELLAAVHERFPHAKCTGVDLSGATIAKNRRRLPWARFERLELDKERLPDRFDAVVCSEVLEHIEDDVSALSNLVEMTSRLLLLTVPTGPVLPLERGFGHLRHYQLDALRARVEALGLDVVRAEAWGFPWMTLFKRVSNLRPDAVMKGFGGGEWSPWKRGVGRALTGLFYFNLPFGGPQILLLAKRR
jgi:SAM-dependent methyltransferase